MSNNGERIVYLTQGDSTDFLGFLITFKIDSDLDLHGFQVQFYLDDITKTWSESDILQKRLVLRLSAEETASLSVGAHYAFLKVTDEAGAVVTELSKLVFYVRPGVNVPSDGEFAQNAPIESVQG